MIFLYVSMDFAKLSAVRAVCKHWWRLAHDLPLHFRVRRGQSKQLAVSVSDYACVSSVGLTKVCACAYKCISGACKNLQMRILGAAAKGKSKLHFTKFLTIHM